MSTFRRALRWFFGLAGFVLGIISAISAFAARMMIAPARQNLWATPLRCDLPYEAVQFPAQDGLRVSGWFIPAKGGTERHGATIILVHGWQWNRLGYDANDRFSNVTGSRRVNLLQLIEDLSMDGYHVLTFDLRNHGESAADHPVTFGQNESRDLLGALEYLQGRDEVNIEHVGAIGFSIGANAILFSLPQTEQISAAIAVQPATPSIFTRRISENLFGGFGFLVNMIAGIIYQLFGGPRLAGIVPAFAASGSGKVPILYIQGTGDEWGSVEDVAVMADMTPGTQKLLFVDSQHRFGGYRYLLDHPGIASQFFEQHLGDAGDS